jgi:hypothetical protein
MKLDRVGKYSNNLLTVVSSEWFQITLLTVLSISAPLFLKSPQLLVGSVVNFVLFFSAKKFGFRKSLPSILLPCLIAYSSNILFKGATYFLIFFIPIIFIGNSIYVLLSRYIKNSFFSVIVSSVCKSLLLYIFAYIFVKEVGLPQIFITNMGVMQLITGIIGGILGLLFINFNKEIVTKVH